MPARARHVLLCAALVTAPAMGQAWAQNDIMHIDATAPVPAPQPVAAALGTTKDPHGDVIGVNSQYLTFDGKPWLPVMGEFHFSRYPESEWESEILKMKAAGVQIVSTYVIWIHHEETEGRFDWSGQRDLRRFVELCGRHGMYVYPRIGPWAHAETRNGGLPDWVLKNSPTRQDNPVYLAEVKAFDAQIGAQLRGLLWKDGGPVIGIQIENEYNLRGRGTGAEHIRTLKKMAVEAGLDVPLYTVTGWDGAAIPLDEVLPVFGGYAAAPWDGTSGKLLPSEVYAFRFNNRAAGSMGAIGGSGQNPASSYRGTPFLTAEVGDGIEDTYFRRPVLTADDVAAIAPVMLGSGANLLGYYMFHGGRNPSEGAITLEESQRTGFPTDVPVRSYDFQAPIGEFGQERESLRKLKLVDYFLEDFGASLATMAVRVPKRVPASPADVTVPRVAARTREKQGFVFFNNYVRGLRVPERPQFQVQLQLPAGELAVPAEPIELPSGAYGIWPINLPVGTATLRYSTAQLFKRERIGRETYFFFFAIPGIEPEFAFDARTPLGPLPMQAKVQKDGGVVRLRFGTAATGGGRDAEELTVGGSVHLVLLSERNAESMWRGDDPAMLIHTEAAAFSADGRWVLQSDGDPRLRFGVLGGTPEGLAPGVVLRSEGRSGVFAEYSVTLPAANIQAQVTKMRNAAPRKPWKFGPKFAWRPNPVPLAPDDADFQGAAVWDIDVPKLRAMPFVSDVLVRIRYQGDVARLSQGSTLLDDNFWNGLPWEVGSGETVQKWSVGGINLRLEVLPLPRRFPMYIQNAGELHFNAMGEACSVEAVEMVPRYQLQFELKPAQLQE